jgi:hypothetical protein
MEQKGGISIMEETQNILEFSVMWENEKTADVYADNSTVSIKRYVIHPVKQIFCKDSMTRYELGQILRTRCWDEHRDGLPRLLAALGVSEYNPYDICRKTHGVMYQDKIWFRYKGEDLTYEDVAIKE